MVEKIDRELQASRDLLLREAPEETPAIDELQEVLEPLEEWMHLRRDHKRRILGSLTPDVRVANYAVSGLYLPILNSGNTEASRVHPS